MRPLLLMAVVAGLAALLVGWIAPARTPPSKRRAPPRRGAPSTTARPSPTSAGLPNAHRGNAGAFDSRRARLEVSLVKATDGSRLSGAVAYVSKLGFGSSTATSDALGKCVLDDLPPGDANLFVSAPGFAPQRVPVVLAGGKRCEARVEMVRGGTVTGDVTDDHGHPVPGAVVTDVARLGAAHYEADESFAGEIARRLDPDQLPAGCVVHTDARGRFVLRGVQPGKQWIFAAAPDNVPARRLVDVPNFPDSTAVRIRCANGGDIAVFSPNDVMRDDLWFCAVAPAYDAPILKVKGLAPGLYFVAGTECYKRVRVFDGETAHCSAAPDCVPLHGTVRLGRRPAKNGALVFRPEGTSGHDVRTVEFDLDADGRYEKLAPPGRGVAFLKGHGYRSVRIPSHPERPRLDLQFPALRLEGRVFGAAGEPVSGAKVRAIPVGVTLPLELDSLAHAKSDASGRFVLQAIDDHAYELKAEGPNGACGECGPVSAAGKGTPAVIQLRAAASVRLHVLDATGRPAMEVLATAVSRSGVRVESFGAGRDLVLAGLLPGPQTIWAVTLDGRFVLKRTNLSPGEEKTFAITVARKGWASVLVPDKTGSVGLKGCTLRIVLADGKGLPRCTDPHRLVESARRRLFFREPLVLHTGRDLKLVALSAGAYRCHVTAPDGRTADSRFTVKTRLATMVLLALPPR